jgi:hypothetical protein
MTFSPLLLHLIRSMSTTEHQLQKEIEHGKKYQVVNTFLYITPVAIDLTALVIPGIRVYPEEIDLLGKSRDAKPWFKLNESIGGGYLGILQASHQLHCLVQPSASNEMDKSLRDLTELPAKILLA